jgi:hypothetical protein
MKNSMGTDRNAFVRDARKPWRPSVADCGGIAVPFAAFSFVQLCLPETPSGGAGSRGGPHVTLVEVLKDQTEFLVGTIWPVVGRLHIVKLTQSHGEHRC